MGGTLKERGRVEQGGGMLKATGGWNRGGGSLKAIEEWNREGALKAIGGWNMEAVHWMQQGGGTGRRYSKGNRVEQESMGKQGAGSALEEGS
jgi:hypothetical protein